MKGCKPLFATFLIDIN